MLNSQRKIIKAFSIENPMRLYSVNRIAAGLLLLAAAVSAPGCQFETDPVYPISGKVSFADGSPARFGIIEFRRDSDAPIVARGSIKKDGTFQVRASGSRNGLTAGIHDAIIVQVVGNLRGGPPVHHHHGKVVADRYRDYTSLLRYYADAPGRDVRIHLTAEF